MLLTIFLVISLFLVVVSEYKWQGALIFTVVIGFLQDPMRKLAATDSSYYAAISLVCFILTFIVLKSSTKPWKLRLICWTNPKLVSLLTLFFYLLALQALNSYARFSDYRLTLVGIFFYLVPLMSLWVGFHIGCDQKILRRFLICYVIMCTIFGFTILLSLFGLENKLLREVGQGIQITGIGFGQSGLWRTSEIAGWHLAAGASFSFILGITSERTYMQLLYFLLSLGFGFISITTGRRKALGLIIIYVSLFLLYFSFAYKSSRLFKILSSIAVVVLISVSSYGMIFNSEVHSTLQSYFSRSSTLTLDESQGRLRQQGIGALLRGFEIAGPMGLGVGAGSNSGTTGIGAARLGVRSLGYVAEGGGGRLVLELGGFGLLILISVAFNFAILYARNFKMGRIYLNNSYFLTLFGMLLFVVVNILSFFSASQLYSDPFVLIIIGLASGTFLSIPLLSSLGFTRGLEATRDERGMQ